MLRKVIGQPQFAIVMLTIGLGAMFRTFASVTWGSEIYTLPTPFGGVWQVGGVTLSHQYISIVVGTLILCGVLYAFFNHTRLGVAMQATSRTSRGLLHGHPVKLIFSLIWAIRRGPPLRPHLLARHPDRHQHGPGGGAKAFAAAVLGGFGSIPGAAGRRHVIGLIELYAGAPCPTAQGHRALHRAVIMRRSPAGPVRHHDTQEV